MEFATICIKKGKTLMGIPFRMQNRVVCTEVYLNRRTTLNSNSPMSPRQSRSKSLATDMMLTFFFSRAVAFSVWLFIRLN